MSRQPALPALPVQPEGRTGLPRRRQRWDARGDAGEAGWRDGPAVGTPMTPPRARMANFHITMAAEELRCKEHPTGSRCRLREVMRRCPANPLLGPQMPRGHISAESAELAFVGRSSSDETTDSWFLHPIVFLDPNSRARMPFRAPAYRSPTLSTGVRPAVATGSYIHANSIHHPLVGLRGGRTTNSGQTGPDRPNGRHHGQGRGIESHGRCQPSMAAVSFASCPPSFRVHSSAAISDESSLPMESLRVGPGNGDGWHAKETGLKAGP